MSMMCNACCASHAMHTACTPFLKLRYHLVQCRHAETHFRGSLYTIAALDGMTRKHLQNVIVDACRQSMHDCVLCLGHNKGWEEAATSFAVRFTMQAIPWCCIVFQLLFTVLAVSGVSCMLYTNTRS